MEAFERVKERLTSPDFIKECRDLIRAVNGSHVTYRVFAEDQGGRKHFPRICKVDKTGILTIGSGAIERLRDISASLRNGKGHHFGLKYLQVKTQDENFRLPHIDFLYIELRVFGSADEAKHCEKTEQMDYRKKFGENPPYSGRWEGV